MRIVTTRSPRDALLRHRFRQWEIRKAFEGPGVAPVTADWLLFDWDTDKDVDLADFAIIQNHFTGL